MRVMHLSTGFGPITIRCNGHYLTGHWQPQNPYGTFSGARQATWNIRRLVRPGEKVFRIEVLPDTAADGAADNPNRESIPESRD